MASPTVFNILANRNPDVPLTAYDGKVGTVLGIYVLTTPNESFIPLPALDKREVRVRQDYRYGRDDHTLWPQPYSKLAPHLGVIPRKPTDTNSPLAVLWRNPLESHFIEVPRGTIAFGVGKLDPTFVQDLEPIFSMLQQRFLNYSKAIPDGQKPNTVAASLSRIAGFAMTRLQSLVTTWRQIRFTITELQRLLLELHGCLDYIEIYKPMIDTAQPAPTHLPAIARIGTITTSVRVVEEFYAVGVPVWYIRERNVVDFGHNVLEFVGTVNYSENLVLDMHPDFPVVYEGDSDSFATVTHILQFARFWLSTPNPYYAETSASTVESAPSPSPSHNPPMVRGTSSRGADGRPPAKKPKTTPQVPPGRNKFAPVDSPYAPYSIPAWAEQLQQVDRTTPPAIERLPRGGFYVFPDPGLFMSVKTDTKRQFMIEQYSRIASMWFSKTRQDLGMALSNDQWRHILAIDFRLPASQWTSQDTKTASRRQQVLDLIVPQGCVLRDINLDDPYEVLGSDDLFQPNVLPPRPHIRKMMFLLYWLNFRSEIIALDRVAHVDMKGSEAQLTREFEIMALMPEKTFVLPLPDGPNFGLFADTLEERLPYLRTFARIMMSWKGDIPRIFGLGKHQRGPDKSIPLDQATELEREVARFYCQQFFNYFRRAAQIPHRLQAPSTRPQSK